MFKIITSKVAARETIKAQLQKEIPLVNEAIAKAMSDGQTKTYYRGDISKPTVKMLNKAGYRIDNWDIWDAPTEIFWYTSYEKIVDNDSQLDEIAKEANIDIVNVQ